jgi:DNA-binding beta-propeller fold protein YncE
MNSLSNNVSVIDLERPESPAGTIPLDESPYKGAMDRRGNSLYVIVFNSPNLVVIDAASQAVSDKIYAGIGSLSVLADPRSELLYVGKSDGEVAIIDPRVLMYIDTMQLSGGGSSMVIDDEENVLFVLTPEEKALHKVNLVGKRTMASLLLEDTGYAVAIMGAR